VQKSGKETDKERRKEGKKEGRKDEIHFQNCYTQTVHPIIRPIPLTALSMQCNVTANTIGLRCCTNMRAIQGVQSASKS